MKRAQLVVADLVGERCDVLLDDSHRVALEAGRAEAFAQSLKEIQCLLFHDERKDTDEGGALSRTTIAGIPYP